MKFTIKRSAAADAVKMCMSVMTGRTTLPILSCLKLEARGGGVKFLSTDLDRWMECTVSAEVTKPGSIALSGKILAGIFAKGDEATVEVGDKNRTVIKCGGSTFKFPGLPGDEMPEPEAMGEAVTVEMASSDWLEASRSVKWAASIDETRATICGTYFTEFDGRLKLVATDGRRLAQSNTEFGKPLGTAIVPTDTMNAINLVADLGDDLHLAVGDGMISARCNGATITSKLICGDYPNYLAVIPAKAANATKVKVQTKPFLEAIERASIMIGKTLSVTLDVTPGRVEVISECEDSKSTCSVEAQVEGPDVRIGLNARFLAEPFKNWEADEVELEISGEVSPVMIRGPHRSEYVLMPMRITT